MTFSPSLPPSLLLRIEGIGDLSLSRYRGGDLERLTSDLLLLRFMGDVLDPIPPARREGSAAGRRGGVLDGEIDRSEERCRFLGRLLEREGVREERRRGSGRPRRGSLVELSSDEPSEEPESVSESDESEESESEEDDSASSMARRCSRINFGAF
jgi:hypothetical protein